MRAWPRQLLTGSLSVGKAQREGIYCWQLPTPGELPILMHTYTVSVVFDNLELTDDVLDGCFSPGSKTPFPHRSTALSKSLHLFPPMTITPQPCA